MNKTALPAISCMCTNLRRASRAITQFYEQALRSTGLRSTQFAILQALTLTGDIAQGQLGHILALDSTTLTRTLAIMSRQGWLKRRRGSDRRKWHIGISSKGNAIFQHAFPLWESAQGELRNQLGDEQWKQLSALAHIVTNAALQ